MATKKTKSFSPYSYGIKYRTPGRNPFQKYNYVPSASPSSEPLYVVTKKEPKWFSAILNNWYFDLNDNGEIIFLKCDSEISINSVKFSESIVAKNISSKLVSTKFTLKKNTFDFKYTWVDDNVLKVPFQYPVMSDIIVLINDIYSNETLDIFVNEGFYEIRFDNLSIADIITIIIYPIEYSRDFLNESFYLKKFDTSDIIYDSINSRMLIKNNFSDINEKFILIDNNNKILRLASFDVRPSYIEVLDKDLGQGVKEVYSYAPSNFLNSFIIQKGIDTTNIKWESENVVKISHFLKGDVNFILDKCDDRDIINKIKKIDENNLEIEFDFSQYIPSMFSIIIFKIGEA